MKCIYCHSPESKVIDSRLNDDGLSIRREENARYANVLPHTKGGNRAYC